MALKFAANGDIVTHAGDIAIQTAATVCMWIYPTDNTARQALFSHQTSAGIDYHIINFRADQVGDWFDCTRQRAPTPVLAQANSANFAAYGLNKWLFLVTTIDPSAVPTILMGDLTKAPAGPSSYTTQTAGSGAQGATVSPFHFGNNNTATTRKFIGRIADVSFFNRVLNAKEIFQLWDSGELPTGCIVQSNYGEYGQRIQLDNSGFNRHGLTTGAILAIDDPELNIDDDDRPLILRDYWFNLAAAASQARILNINQAVNRAATF
jgi:hypothetical protein